MNQLKKHILFFDFLENYYVSNDEVSKQHLSVIKKSNFVKAIDKAIVRSSHPPLETVLITCQYQKTKVKASPFKIADDQTPITSIIEQNNFTNESLHVISQQLDHIEEKIVERTIEKHASKKSISIKTEKPLIDLPSQREKVMFKTSQSETLEVVEKMLSDLKVKTEGTSSSTPSARTISKNGKEIASDENTNFDTISSVSAFDTIIFISDVLKKRFPMFLVEKMIPHDSKAFGHTNITLANFHCSLY